MKKLNILYAKTVLYCYPCIEEFIERIDDMVSSRAFSSINDYTPAIEQYYKILSLTEQKKLYIYLYQITDKLLKKFTSSEKICIEYKYFKNRIKKEYPAIDPHDRNYYRAQERVIKKFAKFLEEKGFNNLVFREKFLKLDLVNAIFKRVKDLEINASKNRTQLKAQLMVQKVCS